MGKRNGGRYFWKVCSSIGLLVLCAASVSAENIAAGKAKADKACAACHGKKGISSNQTIPNLAGQKRIYLESSIKAYKKKQRTGGMANVMAPHAASLSEQEIKDVALYYSEL